jgi:sirohydrochlorin ferrochelatase
MPQTAALLIAHGAPSCPPSQEFALADMAARAEAAGAGPMIAATLAARRPFDAKVAQALDGGGPVIVYPMFMSDGWFSGTHLPRRLAAAGLDAARARMLAPFGMDPLLPALCARRALEAAARMGLPPERVALVLAAHGAPSNKRPAEVTREVAAHIALLAPFRSVTCGFVDQPPHLAEALSLDGPAICLPFFATRASHVIVDLPEAVAAAGFDGPVLGPIGLDPAIPGLIAAAVRRARTEG